MAVKLVILKIVQLLLALCGGGLIVCSVMSVVMACESVNYAIQPSLFPGISVVVFVGVGWIYAVSQPYVNDWHKRLIGISGVMSIIHVVISAVIPAIATSTCSASAENGMCDIENLMALGSNCKDTVIRGEGHGATFTMAITGVAFLTIVLIITSIILSCLLYSEFPPKAAHSLIKIGSANGTSASATSDKPATPVKPQPAEGETNETEAIPAMPGPSPGSESQLDAAFGQWNQAGGDQSVSGDAPPIGGTTPDKPGDQQYMNLDEMKPAEGNQNAGTNSTLEGGPPPGNSALLKVLGNDAKKSEKKDDGLYDNLTF